ncbi:hypothetical protein [Nonomuraea sp. SBT364]|uniref:hypothetical protein n=1 Tax=Nonomuraea sp. SBT364 TaxID=1580530 RepID=UPI00066E8C78|nr:hypothetical protein [Nonomuraea sp. SBT364]
MPKVRALLVSAALATGVLLSMTTAPAQADSIRYAYYMQSDCYNGGNLGIQWGWWTSFRCSYENAGGSQWFWFLYA